MTDGNAIAGEIADHFGRDSVPALFARIASFEGYLATRVLLGIVLLQSAMISLHAADPLEEQFRKLPMEARRLTGPLFWLHGDENETQQRLEAYVEIVAEGGNGCFTAESRPHDWLGPRWYKDLDICLQKAKQFDLQMWTVHALTVSPE